MKGLLRDDIRLVGGGLEEVPLYRIESAASNEKWDQWRGKRKVAGKRVRGLAYTGDFLLDSRVFLFSTEFLLHPQFRPS